MTPTTIVSWDLGGTKCAAAVVQLDEQQQYRCAKKCHIKLLDCHSLDDLIQKVDQTLGFDSAAADAICIGGAGQFDGEHLNLQNGYPFAMDFARAKQQHRWPQFTVIHDYSSVACATFTSYMDDSQNVRMLHQGELDPYGRRVTLGVGTGLGLKDSVLFPDGNFWLGTNEAGHIGITHPPLCNPIEQQRHLEFMQFLRSKHGLYDNEPMTFESILTGKGVLHLFEFLHGHHEGITPEVVGQRIRRGEAPECLQIFAWYLGLFVSTVQLMFMPSGGVWITGGVVIKNLELFDLPDFWHGMQASPCYQKERDAFPVGVLINPEHALIGSAFYAVNRLL